REAHHGIGVAHVDPLRIWAWRIEVDAEGPVQAAGESRGEFGLAVSAHATKDFNVARLAFGDEEVAVGRGANQARFIEVGGVKLNFESLRNLRPGFFWARSVLGAVP